MTSNDPYSRRFFWLLALVLSAWAFWSLSDIVLPVVMGAFAAFSLWPVVQRLPQKWPHGLRVSIAILIALAGVTAFILVLVPSLIDQAKTLVQHYPDYVAALTQLGQAGQRLLASYGLHYDWAELETKFVNLAQSAGLAVAGWIGASLPSAIGNLLQLVVAFWVLIYALLDGPEMIRFFREQLPVASRNTYQRSLGTTGEVLNGFIRGMLLLGLIIGVGVGVGAWILGMPYALLIGLVAGVLEAIPSFGPLIAGAFGIFLALAQGPWMAVKMAGLFAIVQVLENNLVVPRVMGGSLNVHPMVIFLAALIGAKLFGLVGLFLAGPVAAIAWRLWQERQELT